MGLPQKDKNCSLFFLGKKKMASNMTKTRLQSILKENGMPTSGNKNTLIKRVQGIIHQDEI